jgi:molybdenum cofactor synthesis domain-containing protein
VSLEADPSPAGSAADGAPTAIVITASDRGSAGERQDTSGEVIAQRLEALGFGVERMLVPDEQGRIESTLVASSVRHRLVVTTGGTGLAPRDVTPQATLAVVDYEVPGLAELMRAEGRRQTPMAALSRGIVGVIGRSLVVNLPGSPKAALESLEALVPVLPHALETLAGPFDHDAALEAGRDDLPLTDPDAAASR